MPEPQWTGESLEQVFHAALGAGDIKGVEAALTVMAGVDPRRAQQLFDDLKFAVRFADMVNGSGGNDA